MNTKTDQISSGLVAHIAAFKEALNGTRGDLDAWLECNDESDVRQAIFGVISDAEAIINDLNNLVIAENQRKQQLEEQVAKQSAALKLAREALDTISSLEASNGCILSLRECVDIAEEALAAIDNAPGEAE